MSAYITALGIANPPYKVLQKQLAHFMKKAHGLNEQEARGLDVLYRASGIKSRYSVIPDYSGSLVDNHLYPISEDFEPFPSVASRMELYRKCALPLAKEAVLQAKSPVPYHEITHLITVSCTGMYAPGLDIDLVKALNLPTHVRRTCVNFMGCYAAITALKLAAEITSAHEHAKVLIVCVELCSLHFQKQKTEDQLLANALFGDGAAAVVVESQPRGLCLSLEQFYADLALEGEQEMAWNIGNFGFEMKLSQYVPDLIGKGIGTLTDNLLRFLKLKANEVSYYAIHPGGKRILTEIEKALGLSKQANRFAYEVLEEFGNMSSPTVLFVLKKIWDSLQASDAGKTILSFAFGPGLTMESMLLKVHTTH
ncbi:type III polyketide synthase [Cytophagales bacterium LB-30]|uniref:Type III polyketide synthase n=1 Tax=Shiella aurantiaca TaxID=3058365 RepID=A0ABT8F7H3_9BACT|nr:type III polyketide synthase [Shiella aurantiaca]MDN4166426.1 type III polyketide synthase [Shiella aurantiaca]